MHFVVTTLLSFANLDVQLIELSCFQLVVSFKPSKKPTSPCGISPPQRAIQFACNNAVVCDTMEEARRVAYTGERKRVSQCSQWSLSVERALSVCRASCGSECKTVGMSVTL